MNSIKGSLCLLCVPLLHYWLPLLCVFCVGPFECKHHHACVMSRTCHVP